MVFKTNGCSSGTLTSQTKVAHETMNAPNCMVVWGDCSAGHADENAKQNAPFKGNRHCLCVFTYSIAKRKQCNCTAGQSGVSVSPETIYTEGLLSLTFWTFRRCYLT